MHLAIEVQNYDAVSKLIALTNLNLKDGRGYTPLITAIYHDNPDFDITPLALVVSIHLDGERVNELLPASKRKESNSTPLNSGLFNCSQRPKNSIVVRERIQFFTTSLGSSAFLFLAGTFLVRIPVTTPGTSS